MSRVRHRRTVYGRVLAWVAALVSAIMLVVGAGVPATAGEAEPGMGSASGSTAVAAGLPSSAGVTVAGGNSVAADVYGRGYEQVVRLNGSRVEIADPVTRGGAVLYSFDAGASQAWPRQWSNVPIFYGGANMADRVTGHSASRVAVAGGFIYVSTLRTRDGGSFGTQLPDGSVVRKYRPDGVQVGERVFPGAFAVTSLAGFEHQGKAFLAIGLNYSGVRIADTSVAWLPDIHALMEHFKGPDRFGSLPTNERDQITELGFGVVGDRVQLMVGVLTGDMPALLAFDANTGQELWAKNLRPNDPARFEWPQEVEFSPYEVNGRVQIAVGWPTLGRLSFMDAVDGTDRGNIDGGVVGTIRFFTDALGEARVGYRHGRASGWSSHVAKQDAAGRPVVLDNGAERDLEWMVPGYRPWSIQIDNRSRSEITFNSFAGSARAEGCWLGAALHGAPNPLPAQPVSVAAGGRAGAYQAAQTTRGLSCDPSTPGVFYLQVEPVGEPGNRRLVRLMTKMNALEVEQQVGSGRLSVQVERTGDLAARLVITDRHATPAPVDAPVLEAARLTPAAVPGRTVTMDPDDPSRPVHRFRVSGVSWNVPGSAADVSEAAVPLPVAEGSVDGTQWAPLGTVASPVTPVLEGDRLTMGDAVFDWQTAPGATNDYRFFRVVSGGVASNVVDVAQLSAPEPSSAVLSLMITGAGAPRANGLDQVPMRVSLRGSWDQALDAAEYAALYDRVYYRDALTRALVTGLGNPAEPNQLVMFSLEPGQYANELLDAAATTSIGVYFSARQAQARQITAVFKANGQDNRTHNRAVTLAPATNSLLTMGTAANGLSVGSCGESRCALKLMDPWEAPALHSLTATSIGVQFRAIAVPGAASLPLTQPNRVPEELPLLSDSFMYHGTRAMLENPNQFAYNGTITTDLVAHGERLVAENHWIRAK